MTVRNISSSAYARVRWLLALALITIATGAGSWLFLAGLDEVTRWRREWTTWILFAPLAGILTSWFFTRVSRSSAHGNVLLVSLLRHRRERPLARVSSLMAPLIVLTTWISHLTGLSVGREGAAMQMGGGLTAWLGRICGVSGDERERRLLLGGVAAGFASVFGVPLAGAMFALEIAEIAGIAEVSSERHRNVRDWPSVVVVTAAACGADWTARSLGAQHMVYPVFEKSYLTSISAWFSVLISSFAFGFVAWSFLFLLHGFKKFWSRLLPREELRPVVAGALYAPMAFAPLWLHRYAGLGTERISESFTRSLPIFDPILKTLYTVFALGSGFRGGEVMPLFFIGATAGSALATPLQPLHVKPELLASLGFVAVFGAAARVPLTCAVMAVELFGAWSFVFALPVCWLANWFCRHSGLYESKPEL